MIPTDPPLEERKAMHRENEAELVRLKQDLKNHQRLEKSFRQRTQDLQDEIAHRTRWTQDHPLIGSWEDPETHDLAPIEPVVQVPGQNIR